MKRALVLLSGGIDSVVALYHCHAQYDVVGALSFDYGSKHNAEEIPRAAYQAQKLGVPHFVVPIQGMSAFLKSSLLEGGEEIPHGHYEEDNMKSTVVPFRNGIMLSIAAGIAESHEADMIVIANHAGDHAIYPDCRPEFVQSMGDAIRLGTYNHVELYAPFTKMTKDEIVREGDRLGVDFSHTWSCYEGQTTHCGKCGTCVERKEAFLLAHVVDPTPYKE